MPHRIENPFGLTQEKPTPDYWEGQADFLQAQAFMIAERDVGWLRDDPERRLLAIGQIQGFLAALSETVYRDVQSLSRANAKTRCTGR